MIVRELVTRLGFSVNDGQMRKYESGVNNIKHSAEGAANAFRNMFAAFVGVSALQSLVKTTETMQSLESRVGMLPQTVGDASDAFDTVARRASDARQSIDAYGNLYIKIQNAGKDFIKTQEEGLQITDTLSKALVVGGATAQEQSSAMLQFAQAIGSGVLQGDEMRAMGEAAPQFMDELAKAIGVPRSEIKKMGSEGKLTSKIIIEAVKKMSSAFDEKFKQMPMTITQAITIGQNRWAMFINNLNRKSQTVTRIATFLLEGFDKIEKKLNEFVDWIGGANQAVKLFGLILLAALGPAVVGLVVGGLTAIFSAGFMLFAGLLLLAVVLEDVYQFFTGGESVLGDFVEWLNNGTLAASAIKGVLTALILVLGVLAVAFTAAWFAALSGPMMIITAVTAALAVILAFKDRIAEAFGKIKEFFGFGGKVDMSATKVAGAAVSAGGTGATNNQNTKNVEINQTFAPGTTQETAAAAKMATESAISADNGDIVRQMGIY